MALRKSSADAAAVSSAVLSRGTPGAASVPAGARTLKGAFAADAAAAGFLMAAFFGDGLTAATPLGPFLANGAAPLLAPFGALANRACSCRAMALRIRTISDSSLAGGSPSLAVGSATAGVCAGLKADACCGVGSSSSNVMTKGGSSAPVLGRAAASNDGTTAASALKPAGAASRGSKRRASARMSSGGSCGQDQGAHATRESTRELIAARKSCYGHELVTAACNAQHAPRPLQARPPCAAATAAPAGAAFRRHPSQLYSGRCCGISRAQRAARPKTSA